MPQDIEAPPLLGPANPQRPFTAVAATDRGWQAPPPAPASSGASELARALGAVWVPASAAVGMLGGMALGAATGGTQSLLRGMPAPAAWAGAGARVGGYVGLAAGAICGGARTLRTWGPAAARPAQRAQAHIERVAVGLLVGLACELAGAGVGGIVAGAGAQCVAVASWGFLSVALGPPPLATAVWGARVGGGAGVTAVGLVALCDRRVATAPPQAVCRELLAALAARTVGSAAARTAGKAAGEMFIRCLQMGAFAALMATAAGAPAAAIGIMADGKPASAEWWPMYARIAARAGAWTGALATQHLLDGEALFDTFAISPEAPWAPDAEGILLRSAGGAYVVFATAIVGPLLGAAVGGVGAAASWLCQVGEPSASVRTGVHVGMVAPVLLALAVGGLRLHRHLAGDARRAEPSLTDVTMIATAV